MKFYETILRYPKITIAIILLFTLFFGWHARNVNIDNSLEEFLPSDHYAMLQDKLVKNEFNSREMILIGVVNDDGIFNCRSLEKVQSISEEIHKLTVVRPEDESELKEWNSRLDGRYTKQIETILSGGITVADRGEVRSLRIEAMNDETVDNDFRLFLDELLLRLSPISEVISIADVDNITASEWGLTVEPLMAVIPNDENGMNRLKSAVFENDMYLTGLVSKDGTGTVLLAELAFHYDHNPELAIQIFRELEQLVKPYQGPEIIAMGGVPVVNSYMTSYMTGDLAFLTPVIILVMLVALYLIFRFIKGVFIPISVVLAALIWTYGLMGLTGTKITLLMTAMPVIIIAIGIADGIHIFAEYKLQWSEHRDKRQAIIATMKQLTRPIILTSVTTIAGFASLSVSVLSTITDFGIFTSVGIFSAMVFSLTFIPAALSLMAPPKQKKRVSDMGRYRFDRIFRATGTAFVNNRKWIIAGTFILFAASLFIIPRIKVGGTMVGTFHKESEIYRASEILNDKFGGTEVLNIVIDTGRRDGLKDPNVLGAIAALQDSLKSHDLVGYTTSFADYIKRINLVMNDHDSGYNRIPWETETVTETDWIKDGDEFIEVMHQVEISGRDQIAQFLLLYENAGGDDLEKLADFDYSKANIIVQIRTDESPLLTKIKGLAQSVAAERFDASIAVYFAGCAYLCIVIDDMIITSQLQSLALAFFVVFFLLCILFRSFSYGLLGMFPIVMTVAIAFSLLSITGVNLDSSTSIIASIVLGIGVDYSVHFLSRFRSLKEKGLPANEIIAGTLNTSGRAIIFNALTVAAGFFVLLMSSFWPVIHIGWLVAVSMITSAAFALILLSAIMGKDADKIKNESKQEKNKEIKS